MPGFIRTFLTLLAAAPTVGGQAVIEGVMMRNRDKLAIAVRKPDGTILVESRPWFSLTKKAWLRKPFIRGFPMLVETMVNGIKALNFSASHALEEEDGDGELKPWHLALTLCFAIAMALGLFVVVPHLFSIGMQWLGLGGGAENLSFHAWDGFFKLAVFLGYILAISLIPDIRRVFQYHGAEHKTIWTFERGLELTPAQARLSSRLHPRCGTTFLLFVLTIAILLHTILVPLLLMLYTPGNVVVKHAYIVTAKLLLMVPISALAYELIKFAGQCADTAFCKALSAPGMFLQMLTTHEPDDEQLEVAIASLEEALADGTQTVDTIADAAAEAADEGTPRIDGMEEL